MTDLDFESQLRRGLDGYADTIVVTPPPLDDLLDRPTPRHSRTVLVGAGIAAAAATATVALAVAGGVLSRDDGPQDGQQVATSPPGDCDGLRADGDTVGGGALPDGRRWRLELRDTPPNLQVWGFVGGEGLGGYQHNVWSWSGLVNEGALNWQLDVFDGGRLLYGEVPPSAAAVQARLEGGRTVWLCPVTVPGLDAVRFAAAALPLRPDIREIVMVDAADRPLARQDVTEVIGRDLTGIGSYSFFVNVDAELVDLPLGGVAVDDPATAPTQPVTSGELPTGPWSVSTGVLRDPPEPHYLVRLVFPAPHQGMTVAATVDEHLDQSTWQVSSLDGRLILWGPTPADVTEVVVTSEDGRTLSIPTQPSGVEGFEMRVFADDLPEGALPEAIEGRTSDGTTVLRATDLASSLTPVVDFPPGETVSVPVDQLDD